MMRATVAAAGFVHLVACCNNRQPASQQTLSLPFFGLYDKYEFLYVCHE